MMAKRRLSGTQATTFKLAAELNRHLMDRLTSVVMRIGSLEIEGGTREQYREVRGQLVGMFAALPPTYFIALPLQDLKISTNAVFDALSLTFPRPMFTHPEKGWDNLKKSNTLFGQTLASIAPLGRIDLTQAVIDQLANVRQRLTVSRQPVLSQRLHQRRAQIGDSGYTRAEYQALGQ